MVIIIAYHNKQATILKQYKIKGHSQTNNKKIITYINKQEEFKIIIIKCLKTQT
jgi:hypothetical protein